MNQYSETNKPLYFQITLNELLDQIEIDVSKLGQGNPQQAEKILYQMDEIEIRFNELIQHERPFGGEEAQFNFISTVLKKNQKTFLKQLGGANRLKELRQSRKPQEGEWWWYLDLAQAHKNKMSIKHSVFWGVGVTLLILILIGVYQLFLAPSPQTQLVMQAQDNGEVLISNGNYSEALTTIDNGLAVAPEDITLWILKGIAESELGESAVSEEAFSEAEKFAGSHESFLLNRTLIYIRIGDNQSGLTDVQEVISNNSQSAEAFYYEGTILKNLGENVKAYTAYETASTLASAQGNTALEATARLEMAMLLQ